MDINVEVAAIQMTLLALINTHQNKKALLLAFDEIVAAIKQAPSGNHIIHTQQLREALDRFRGQITAQID